MRPETGLGRGEAILGCVSEISQRTHGWVKTNVQLEQVGSCLPVVTSYFFDHCDCRIGACVVDERQFVSGDQNRRCAATDIVDTVCWESEYH